jgi:putative flavoprotein involved in K+ transport
MPKKITTVIIGAGQAGLAFSRCLSDEGVDHVVLERGRVANSWSTERWDSLRLLTPNWQSRLPGYSYGGPDPDGYMTMPEVSGHLLSYARSFGAPVEEHTSVMSVARTGRRSYEVKTDQGVWSTPNVVIASGAFSDPAVPRWASNVPSDIVSITPNRYRNPDQLPDGGVLVVGASASGVQLADELVRSGRSVVLAASSHSRMPRTYRGMDIQWWLDAIGTLDARYDEMSDPTRARRAPSLQLVGTPERRSIDLGTLSDSGVRVAGRLLGIDASGRAAFCDDLAAEIASAEAALGRRLDRYDRYAAARNLDRELDPPTRPEPVSVGEPPTSMDLVEEGIATVVWATGFRPRYPWLDCSLLDARGAIPHEGGVVTSAPGLYVMGLPFMRRRKSSFIDGVGDDARDLSAHLVASLHRTCDEVRAAFRAA